MSLGTKLDGFKQMWQFDNRYSLIAARLLRPNEQVATYRYKGIEFLTDRSAGDTRGAREILTTDTYRQFLPKMDLPKSINVLDIGANNGGFSLLLLSEGFHINKLAGVELNPRTFARMVHNVEPNANGEFIPINAAVCGENKTLEVQLGEGDVGDNIYTANGGGTKYEVAGRTFDSIYDETFGKEKVDLCKIDIEGAEFDIIQSGAFQNLRNCRYVLMEIHHEPHLDRTEVIEALRQIGLHEVDGVKKTDAFHHVHFFANT